jgi:hypothetical protein
MKKFLAYFTVILFLGVISLSVLAFSKDDPEKKKTETASTAQCDQHKQAAADTTQAKPCGKKSAAADSTGCAKAAECKHHSESADCKKNTESADCKKHTESADCKKHTEPASEAK